MTRNERKLRMGMVGGGRDAFIGAVHRMAARLDGEFEFVAGAMSSTPEKAIASGRDLGLLDDRNYPTWQAMLYGEIAQRENAIDFVTIVTPNHSHFEIARAFAQQGFHLFIDKPMTTTVEQAEDLRRLVQDRNLVCCVTYNYCGYPMIKQARDMVGAGEIGEIRKIIVEYNQGWLSTPIEDASQKQAVWRTQPETAGVGGAIADIGTHAQQLISHITGLEIESLCADLASLVSGRKLDDDANILLRFKNGARGVLVASQVCTGERNNLCLRIWGTKAGIEWNQEDPNRLILKPMDGPERIYHRGESYLCAKAKQATRLPSGHPEAFIEALANIYQNAGKAIRKRVFASNEGSDFDDFDYPGVDDGLSGVRFIHAAVNSSRHGGQWTSI